MCPRRMVLFGGLALALALAAAFALGLPTREARAGGHESLAVLELRPLSQSGSPGKLRSVKLGVPVTSTPDAMMVYRVIEPQVTPASAEKEAGRFGVTGKAHKNDVLTIVKGKDSDIVVDNETGSVNWVTPDYEGAVAPIKTRLSDAQYVALAEEFLKSKGHFGADYEFAGFGQITADGQPVVIEVSFGRKLGGVRWLGVGPKKTVAFGEAGKILGMFSVWREVEPVTKYPVMKIPEALSQVEAGDASVVSDDYDADAVVTSVEIVYISDPAGSKQKFVIPHYRLQGKTATGKPFTAITRAIPREYVDEQPSGPPATGASAPATGRTE